MIAIVLLIVIIIVALLMNRASNKKDVYSDRGSSSADPVESFVKYLPSGDFFVIAID
jgi:hypothetical protein